MNRTATLSATVEDNTARGLASVNNSVNKSLASAERRQEKLIQRNSASLANEAQKIIRSVNPLATATTRYNQQVAKLRAAHRESAISSREFSEGLAGLNRRLRETEDRARGVQRRSLDISGAFRQAAGAVAAIGGGVSVGLIGRDAISTASNYEQQLNAVRAVTGATAREFERLNEKAREIGGDNSFAQNATQAAQAMELLGREGLNAQEIVGAVDGNLRLASAGALELQDAVGLSTTTLDAFGLAASDSDRAINVLVTASQKAGAPFQQLGESLAAAGPTARAFGVSLEETAASLAKLNAAGIEGGAAGAQFKAIVTRLEQGRDNVRKLIGDFDIDAEGLTAVLRRIGQAGLSDQQEIKLVGPRNIAGFKILTAAALDAADGTDTLTKSLQNAEGAAKKVADIRLKGVNDAFADLKKTRDAFFLDIGEAGGLGAVESAVRSVIASLSSPAAKEFAQSIGQGLAGAVKGLQDNWALVVTATKAATVAAVAYGAAAAASFAGKTIASITAFISLSAQSVAVQRANAAAAISNAQAETVLAASRAAEIAVGQKQLQTQLALIAAQRAEAVSNLELAKGITIATGRRTAEVAAQAQVHASTRALIATRRALAVAETQQVAAQSALTASTAKLSAVQTANAVSATGMTGALGRLALAAKGAGTALAFASVGGASGIARGFAGIATGLGVAALAAAKLGAVSLGGVIAQFTGLSAVAAVIGGPLTAAVVAIGAAGAALFVFRKDIAEAVTGTRDTGVALAAVGKTINDAFADIGAKAKPALAVIASGARDALTPVVALAKGLVDLHRAASQNIETGGLAEFRRDLAIVLDASIERIETFLQRHKLLRDILEAPIRVAAAPGLIAQDAAQQVRRNAVLIENQRTRTRLAGSDAAPVGVIRAGIENADEAEAAFFRLSAAGEQFNVVTDDATKKAVELANAQNTLAGAGGAAAAAQEQLTDKINTQRASLAAQAAELKALNDLRASGASDDEIAVLEKRQQLLKQFPEFAKANRDLFDQEVERLALEERRAETLKDTETARKRQAEELTRAQEEAARDLTQRRDQLARGFADVFVDVWRSFRTEGLSAIDVIKDALRNAFDNFLGQTIENAFRPLAEQILTGRTPELNQAGQVFTQAAIDARAKGLSGPADPFGQSPGVSTAGITSRDLLATLNNQTDIFGNLFGSIKGGLDNFINVGTNLGQSLGKLLGGGGQALGALGGGAAGGFAGFQLGTGVADLFNGRQGETGSKIGGAAGGAIGFAVGGPVGAAIGSAAGGFIGDILGGLFGRKTGSATTNLSTGNVSDVKQSKKDSRNELRDAIAEGAFDAINAVKNILEATLDSSLGLRVNVGKKSASADLIDAQTGRTLGTAALDKDDIDASIRAALKLVVDRGFEGVDSTLGKVTKALTQTSLPAERLVANLSTISEALRFGEDEPSVWATAIKDLRAAFGEAIDAAGGLGSAVRDLAEVQVEALQKIADNFDEDVEKQIRTIRAPQEQEALDLLEAQLKRLADAQGINDALARAQATVTAAPAAGAGSGAGTGAGRVIGGRDDFLRGGVFGAGGAFNLAAQAAATAAPAITDAAAAMQDLGAAANDNSEAQSRLARVNELAQAEWEQFIRQAGDTPEALSAVAAALAQIGDRAADLGLDLASLNAQLAEVKRGLAATFDEEIERQRLSIEQPGQAQALEIFEQQAARFEAARAVSENAADEQARLTRVVALNTAEWRQFIDQAASTPETLADAADALEAYSDRLAAQGVDPSLLRQRVSEARGQLAGTFNNDVAQRLLQLANPTLAEFNSLLVEQQKRVETAQSLGANVSGAERLNALERRRFFEGLSDAQKTELGDFLGIIEDFSGRYAFVLSEFLGSTEAARESLEEVVQGYTESADAWKSVTANLRSTLEGIRSEFAPGNLSEQLRASTTRFDDALTRSRDPSLTDEQRRTAAESLGSIGQDTLRLGRDLFGTTAQFGALFDRVTTGLEGAITAGEGAETLARAQADAARAAAESLAVIERQLQQPDLSLPILEEQRQRLAGIEGVSTRQAELLDELIAIERARSAQQEFAITGLQSVNAPLLQSTGNPALDAEAARIVARAVEQSGLNVIQAIGTSADISEERLRALEATIGEQRDELAELKRLLRNFLDTQSAAQQAAA